MTWIKFITWLCGLYTAYYAVLIFWDHHRMKRTGAHEQNQLSFDDIREQLQVVPEALTSDGITSAVIASGGMSLKELQHAAREETIEFTRAVSF